MKTIYLLIVMAIVLCFNKAHSQTIDQLDEKSGWKGFKLGSKIEDYAPYIEQEKEGFYKYNGGLYKDFLGVPIEKIVLATNKDRKLIAIIIFTGIIGDADNIQKSDLLILKNKLVNLFGNYTFESIDKTTKEITYQWIAKNTKLDLSAKYFISESFNYYLGEVTILDKKYFDYELKKEF